MKKKWGDYVIAGAGAALLIAGLILKKSAGEVQGILLVLPYVLLGCGCGVFGHGMGSAISRRALEKSPEMRKQMEIDQNDERNIAIRNRAKGKAFDFMIYVFSALMFCFLFMEVELGAILLFVFAYTMVSGSFVYYLVKYEREM